MSGRDLYPSVSGAEYDRRYKAVWRAMEERRLDALLVYGDSASQGGNSANVYYLTGYRDPIFAYVLVPLGQEPVLLISNSLYLPHAKTMADVAGVDWVSWNVPVRLAEVVRSFGLQEGSLGLVGVRGIQKSSLPHDHIEGLVGALPDVSWEDATEVLQRIRRIKSDEEIAFLRRGAELTDLTVSALHSEARGGMSEHELAGIIHGAAMRHGGEQRLTFIGSTSMRDPDLIFPRQEPSHREVAEGDIVLTELSTAYCGYAGQIHRPLVVGGEGASPEYQELFDAAAQVYEGVLDAMRPGNTDDDVRTAARSVLEGSGMWTFDALVHGWGLTIEPPRLDVPELARIARPQESITFEPGMVLVVQPHILAPDTRRGLQVGSVVVITDKGADALQRYPMEMVLV